VLLGLGHLQVKEPAILAVVDLAAVLPGSNWAGRRSPKGKRRRRRLPIWTFEGADDEILPFVISQNLRRRHLDASQSAMIAARAGDDAPESLDGPGLK
jgi:hypothetical protein